MTFLLSGLATWYVLVALLLGRTWWRYWQRDRAIMTPSERCLSGLMLVISSVGWLVSLPLTYLALLRRQAQTAREQSLEELLTQELQHPPH
ncbi:MAG: hypothetical protein RLZZ511_1885 [Cyanobacteriota bacterium]|jgi:hypothetical protein